jgi:hypothetical protein
MSESQYFQDCLLDAARSSALAEVEAVLHAGRSMVGSVLQASDPKTGATALHFAASTCDLPVGRCLLRAGHAPDACDKYGKTPLHYACARGHDAFVALLVRDCAALSLLLLLPCCRYYDCDDTGYDS